MAFVQIPLKPTNQKFTTKLGSKNYKLQTIFRINTWYLDIFNDTDTALITAIPMVQGIDLLEQHQHLIRGSLYVINTSADEVSSFFSLGREINLYWEDIE